VDEYGSRAAVAAACCAGADVDGEEVLPVGGNAAHEDRTAEIKTSGSFDMLIPVRTASGEV
jgi:hypothetical protein